MIPPLFEAPIFIAKRINIVDKTNANCYIQLMKQITYQRAALKSLRKMQPKRRDAIVAKVELYASGGTVDVKALVGSEFLRIRVGQDRVIVDDKDNVVDVIDAGPRGGIYKE